MIFADGNALLISSSCCIVTGLNHFFRLLPNARGLNSCFLKGGGKINSVSGLYSMKPGGVNLCVKTPFCPSTPFVTPFLTPFLQQPSVKPFVPLSMQHPLPPFVVLFPQHFPALNVCAASKIGRYPVHLQRLPSNASSTSCSVGF